MRVVGFVGSPRKGGNTDLIVEAILGGALGRGAAVEKVYLNDLRLGACQDCGGCRLSGRCVVDDDLHLVVELISRAGAVVIGSPVYCGSVTAQTKALIDRLDCCLVEPIGQPPRSFRTRLHGPRKGIVVVVAAGNHGAHIEVALVPLRLLLRDLGIRLVGELKATGLRHRGEARGDARVMREAERLGGALVGGGA